MSGYGASSTCRQAAGRSAILGPGRLSLPNTPSTGVMAATESEHDCS